MRGDYEWIARHSDTGPTLAFDLTAALGDVDLTDASAVQVRLMCIEVDDRDGDLPDPHTFTGGALDSNTAVLTKNDTFAAMPAGLYFADVLVTWSDGSRESFPNGTPLLGRIYAT